MTEWTVVGVIVVLIGLIISVVSPILKLNTTIIKLTTIVENMAKNLEDLTNRNASTHERLFTVLDDHERRINILEVKEDLKKEG